MDQQTESRSAHDWMTSARPNALADDLIRLEGAIGDPPIPDALRNMELEGLDGRRYLSARVAEDRLLPVVQARAGGLPALQPGHARLLAYDPAQALGRLLDDHIAHLDGAPPLPVLLRCDSVDSLREYVLRGLGVAWLPRSMVAADLEAGRLATWSDPRLAIDFEIRLFRRKRLASPALQQVWDAFTRQG